MQFPYDYSITVKAEVKHIRFLYLIIFLPISLTYEGKKEQFFRADIVVPLWAWKLHFTGYLCDPKVWYNNHDNKAELFKKEVDSYLYIMSHYKEGKQYNVI